MQGTTIVVPTLRKRGIYPFPVDGSRGSPRPMRGLLPRRRGSSFHEAGRAEDEWYILHTYSRASRPRSRRASKRQRAEAMAWREAQIGEVLIPTEDVVEVRDGKKVVDDEEVLPGLRSRARWKCPTTPGTW